MRVLDFGGAATLPIFYFARLGCEVLSLDIDEELSKYTNELASQRDWNVRSSTLDLTRNKAPVEWGKFDRVVSYCVLEHLPEHLQQATIAKLGGLLEPGGIFALTFDYGQNAPADGAIRNEEEVERLITASSLSPMGNREFVDTGERFRLDKKHPGHGFTFGSLFLRNG
jgi:cyclopropane fatty-acyl-phospholipid synthase-like methyltransferase